MTLCGFDFKFVSWHNHLNQLLEYFFKQIGAVTTVFKLSLPFQSIMGTEKLNHKKKYSKPTIIYNFNNYFQNLFANSYWRIVKLTNSHLFYEDLEQFYITKIIQNIDEKILFAFISCFINVHLKTIQMFYCISS